MATTKVQKHARKHRDRRTPPEKIMGRYANVPTSSTRFAARKRAEIAAEGRR